MQLPLIASYICILLMYSFLRRAVAQSLGHRTVRCACLRFCPNLADKFRGGGASSARQFCTARSLAFKPKKKKKKSLQSADEIRDNLIRVLNSEIRHAFDYDLLYISENAPTGFPFEVEDTPGAKSILLTREFEDVNISIQVDIPSSVTGSNDEGGPMIPMTATVCKEDGQRLKIDGMVAPGRIMVNGLSLNQSDSRNLNGNMKQALNKYLEMRGLDSSTADFIIKYMMGKDAGEYLRWLQGLKSFFS